ncbi:MAG: S1 RNA-binding domain-containing protein [Planctomycetia bacterium]|nr:S1 RNA-binding domain-containing protein [Planctomycetia bacterium]
MSSHSDSAPSAPASSADLKSNPGASPSAESAPGSQAAAHPEEASGQEAEGRRKGPPIRIGTQRYGVKPPAAVPKPVLPSPPAALLAKAHASADDEPTSPAESSAMSATPAAEAADPALEAGPASAPESAKPGKKSGGRKPRASIQEQPQPRKYPPPNTRGQLSPDLELEFMEALGNESLDEIIASGTPSTVVAELEPESRHKGKVISIHRDNVFVEIGGRQQGLLPLKNFETPPEPGAVLDVMVSRFNPAEGFYELVLPGAAVDIGDWSEVAEGMVVEARVTGHNKGGLECEVNRLRGFIPAGQVSIYRVEDLAQFVDQKFACVIIEANPEKRNLVLSRRAMLEREKAEAKEALMAELEVGQVREGTVRSLQSFGAFVDLGGVDGLIHISQLSWDRIKHASEALEVGQKVKVKIQKIDPQTGKIGLAFRDLSESPWANAARDFPSRSRVKGTVSRLMEFGAFVRLAPGVEGLIHISELSHKRVFRVSDVLAEGQEVEVMVLSVDAEQQRISLSLKALETKSAPAEKPEEEPAESAAAAEPPKKRKEPLKGGIGGPAGGEKFGLKW